MERNSDCEIPEISETFLRMVRGIKSHILHRDSFFGEIQWGRRGLPGREKGEKIIGKGEILKIAFQEMKDCQRCSLGKLRKNLVYGEGNPEARIVFVGEAPGADEDQQGRPFVGRAGQLLTDIIVKGMKMKREDVYICNILKCRPPENRNPLPEEITQCEPFLKKQLKIISPEIICALGTFAARTLLKTEAPISALRGSFHFYEGIKVMPTYHPAYLLRNPNAKRQVWEDIQKIMNETKFLRGIAC